jgi:excisionase family DNA binding protein
MTTLGDLLDGLDGEDLQRLAERLAPYMATPSTDAPAYTPKGLAEQLGRSERSIRAAISRGELAACKRGRGWIIGADAVAEWTRAPARAPKTFRSSLTPRRRSTAGPAREALKAAKDFAPNGR